jgi:hypothetical protein
VRGRGVEVEVVLLDVLAVVALGGHHAEEPLLQDRVALVPEGQGEDEDLVTVADGGQAVLAPAVGLAAREVVREVVPRAPVRAVVLADGAPGPLGHVRPPVPPGVDGTVEARQARVLFVGRDGHLASGLYRTGRTLSMRPRPAAACVTGGYTAAR